MTAMPGSEGCVPQQSSILVLTSSQTTGQSQYLLLGQMFLFYAPKIRHYLPYWPCLTSPLILRLLCLKKKLIPFSTPSQSLKALGVIRNMRNYCQTDIQAACPSFPQPAVSFSLICSSLFCQKQIQNILQMMINCGGVWQYGPLLTGQQIQRALSSFIGRMKMVRHIISTELCTGPPINASQ